MTDHLLGRTRGVRRVTQGVAALAAIALAGIAGGCLNRQLEPSEPRTTSTIVERLSQSAVDKIDLVLMLDNSRSMADKQEILKEAVPDLVRGLVNPNCIDAKTKNPLPDSMQPASPLTDCPAGSKREFNPVLDFHIGIISSSLGGHGSDSCLATAPVGKDCMNQTLPNQTNDDKGHLVTRSDSCGGPAVPTYKNATGKDTNFLAWDPSQKLKPAGEADLNKFISSLGDMVTGVGQIGCGFEASLESWYRFLVDPTPYDTIAYDTKTKLAVPAGKDTVLLAQRAEFLRPTSLVAVIMLTDENDCSVKDGGIAFYAIQQKPPGATSGVFRFPRARAECEKNPGDPCCRSCTADQKGCPADANCTGTDDKKYLSDSEDPINLRCWDQKRRFGYDFLQPIDRYRAALQDDKIADRDGNMVDNPLYAQGRDHGLVFLAGIIGVPWQLIARDATDLKKGFKTFDELNTQDTTGSTTWQKVLGDPTKYILPTDQHMVESRTPRTGLPGVNSDPAADKFNGHEYTTDPKAGDLEYACIFKLPTSRSCAGQSDSCDCAMPDANNPNPLCDTQSPTTQVNAKAYPGLRELAALQAVNVQGIVASVCPAQTSDKTSTDYGYRPAIGSIIDRLKQALTGQCLPRQLSPDANGLVSCLVLEGHNKEKPTDACCDKSKARLDVDAKHKQAEEQARATAIGKAAKWDCMCEVVQAGDPEPEHSSTVGDHNACANDASDQPKVTEGAKTGKNADGWCYVDATTNPPTGNADIVKDCVSTERHLIRFVGAGNPAPGATLFISCSGE